MNELPNFESIKFDEIEEKLRSHIKQIEDGIDEVTKNGAK